MIPRFEFDVAVDDSYATLKWKCKKKIMLLTNLLQNIFLLFKFFIKNDLKNVLTILKARMIHACVGVGVGDMSPDRGELLGDDAVDPVSWNFISFNERGDTEDTWCKTELLLPFAPFTMIFVS